MILADREIRVLSGFTGDGAFNPSSLDGGLPLISPYREDQLNPASYDLVLGNSLLIESELIPDPILPDTDDPNEPLPDGESNVSGAGMVEVQGFANATEENPFLLFPGQFALASSEETINLPNWISAAFYLKSSRAREGLEHSHAGFCDPGWNGSTLTLELSNVAQFEPQTLYPGKKIGQLVFFRMSVAPSQDYSETGRYNNDQGATASRG